MPHVDGMFYFVKEYKADTQVYRTLEGRMFQPDISLRFILLREIVTHIWNTKAFPSAR